MFSGILGGTFDPVHIGHLRTGVELLQRLPLDEIRFVPCGRPPHRAAPVASAEQRLAMTRSATAGQPGFVVDDRELLREGPSYTVDTLASLHAERGDRRLALILGMDAFSGIESWYRWQDIFALAHVVVVHRPGPDVPERGGAARMLAARGATRSEELLAAPHGRILLQPVTQLQVSSSAIRRLVSRGEDPRFLVTDGVRGMILAGGLYDREGPEGKESMEARTRA